MSSVKNSTASEVLLDITKLSVHAGSTDLVHGLSLQISAGERVGVIGESGSGKSISSLAAIGLLPAGLRATGSVQLGGVEVVGARDRALQPLRGAFVGTVFQEPLSALDPLMRVGRQVAEPLHRHLGLSGSELEAAVAQAFAEVSLADRRLAQAYPHELSGGQRQRVAIALALAAQPRLLIADEPTTALDVTVQGEVLDLLDRLVTERRMGLLFVSHDLAVISRMTDRVYVMQQGEVVESGRVETVLRHPQHPYTQQLIGHARALDDALGDSAGFSHSDRADGSIS